MEDVGSSFEQNVDGDRTVTIPQKLIESGGYILFTNTKTASIDTAAHFDSLPYILTLAFVIPAGVFFFRKRRRTA